MANSNGFISFLLEQLQPLGGVSAKRMFGGHGVFRDGLMFALVVDDQLYFKGDEALAEKCRHLGLTRFSYNKAGKVCHINYYQAPESSLDDPEELIDWAQQAFSVARVAAK